MTQFERESGIELSRDLKVLIKVKASFDPQYGFSLNITEIDSGYTLGDIARRYQQIVERLTTGGLIDRNKNLPTPFDLNRILVIAPEKAAGLGDFKKDADALQKLRYANLSITVRPFREIRQRKASCKAWHKL